MRADHARCPETPLAYPVGDDAFGTGPMQLRVSSLRRRFPLSDSTARLIASLAFGDARQ